MLGFLRMDTENNTNRPPKEKIPRKVKVGIAAFGVAWGVLFLLSVLVIPIFGYAAIDVVVGPWSFPLLLIGAILVLPYVEKRLK